MASARTALVTGGNRGIGLEICRGLARRGLRVLLAAREAAEGEAAARSLAKEGDVRAVRLDVASEEDLRTIEKRAREAGGPPDVLVNNAGVLLDEGASALTVPPAAFQKTWEVNVAGPFRLCQIFIPGMRERDYGRVVNMSSGLGQMDGFGGGYPAYRLSKLALNGWTRVLAAELRGTGVLVNSMSPGWVRTRMGGAGAPLSPEQGAETAVWLATLPDGGPQGGFFEDRKPVAW
jgi:NAD(P)-dependent dehydrogenase (short-subunit alcohol dehydrogenase family)